MYRHRESKILKEIKIFKMILSYKAEYSLEWTSVHYGEDEVDITKESYFHSGPQDVSIYDTKLSIYLGKKPIITFPVSKNMFKDLILESLRKNAKNRDY